MEEIQQSLSETDVERNLLDQHLKDLQAELRITKDHLATKSNDYEDQLQVLHEKQEALIEQQYDFSRISPTCLSI